MSVELYIEHFSQPSRALMAFCVEAKIPHTLKEVRLAKLENFKPDFLKISPWGTVPAAIHNGLKLRESHAIMCYLADVYNVEDHWYPKDPSKRVYVDTYLHWHHENIRGSFAMYFFNKYFGPKLFGTKFNKELNDSLVIKQAEVLSYIDEILKDSFIAGTEKPTIGDISCYCELSQMFLENYDFSKYQHVTKWMKYMGSLPGIVQAHRVFYTLLPRTKL